MHRRLAVLGHPIAHSKSPVIHRAAYRLLELPWAYSAIRIDESALARFLAGRGTEWLGLSLTMPLKEAAHRLSRDLDVHARASGVVNTLRRNDDGDWSGYNTDIPGLAAALTAARLDVTRTLILGSGATAVSAILAARHLGAETITIAARNADARAALSERFGVRALPLTALAPGGGETGAVGAVDPHGPTVVITTLPGPAARGLALNPELFGVPLYDVAYDPWPSPLASQWEQAGGTAHAGTSMLLEQAILQVRIFVADDPARVLPNEAAVRETMGEALSTALSAAPARRTIGG